MEQSSNREHVKKTIPKLVVFDLDNTLINEGFSDTEPILCDDTLKILEYLKSKPVKIVLATHNYSVSYIIDKLGIDNYFDLVLAYHDYTNKASHLWNTVTKFDVQSHEIVFYDDLAENIRAVRMQELTVY